MYTPLNDRVILRRMEVQPENSGNFVIPDAAKEKATECEVVSIAPFYYSEYGFKMEAPCKAGDRVLIGKYSGNEHKVGGEMLVIVRWTELLAAESGKPSAEDLDNYCEEQGVAAATGSAN